MQAINGSTIKWLQENQRGDFEIHARFTVEMFGGKRWCFTIFALFMVCPRSFFVAASKSNRRSHPIPIPKTLSAQPKSMGIIPRWSLDTVLKDKGNALRLEESEPGFDFDDEEMKKLKIWPGGAIPYYIDEFSFDKVFRDRLRNFLDMTNSATGLNFLELPRPPGDDETRWVLFVNRQGLLNCVDHPFKNFTNEGVQKVVLGYDCLSNGGGIAEVVLALVGVPPQHNAPDRNTYIEIMKDNIMPGKASLFDILKDSEWLFHDVDYDFASAGHYSLHKYTKNGKATIKPLNDVQIPIGEGKGFSYTDVGKIRMMYSYISKNRLKSVSIPECNKLFNRGTHFSNYIKESEEIVQPRKKPNRYLGLPAEPKSSNIKDNETETHTPNTKSIEENAHVDSTKEQDIGNLEDNGGQSGGKGNPERLSASIENPEDNDKKLNKDITDNSSHAESGSEVDHKPHGLKFTKPGHRGSLNKKKH